MKCQRCERAINQQNTEDPELICNMCLEKENAQLSAALRKLLDAPQGSTKYFKVWGECNEVLNRCGSQDDDTIRVGG